MQGVAVMCAPPYRVPSGKLTFEGHLNGIYGVGSASNDEV